MKDMNILLTGGLGNIGSYISNKFSYQKYDVTIVDNFSNIANIKMHPNIKIKKRDIRDKTLIDDLYDNRYNIIIHLAAQISVDKSINDPIHDAENNIDGTLNILEISRRLDTKNFIYISSAAVYGRPIYSPIDENHPTNAISPYGLSKLTGERYSMLYHHLYDIPTVCLRIFNVYSPHQNPNNPYSGVITKFIDRVRNDENPIIFGDGNQTRDFVYIDDVTNAILKSIENKNAIGKIFNIGTGRPIKIKDLAGTIIDISNKKQLVPEFTQHRTGDIVESCANIANATKMLGYEPKYSLENGLQLCFEKQLNKKDE